MYDILRNYLTIRMLQLLLAHKCVYMISCFPSVEMMHTCYDWRIDMFSIKRDTITCKVYCFYCAFWNVRRIIVQLNKSYKMLSPFVEVWLISFCRFKHVYELWYYAVDYVCDEFKMFIKWLFFIKLYVTFHYIINLLVLYH